MKINYLKHELRRQNVFWPKLKDCKSKDKTYTNKIFRFNKD